MSGLDRRQVLLPALLIVIAGCESDVTQTDAKALLALDVVYGEGAELSRIDQARVILEGPTPRDVFITPGAPSTIDGLMPGTYTVSIEGLTGGEVELYGERTGVIVNAGPPVPVAVTVNSFVPILFELPAAIELPGPSATSTFAARFTAVTGAAGYKLEWAGNPAFQNATVIDTENPEWITGPFQLGTYYFRVRAFSKKTGTAGKLSPVGTATVTLTPVANVTVSPPGASLEPGQTLQLTATLHSATGTVLTGRSVTWTSSNASVATVSATGVLTGLAPGSSTITVFSEGVTGTAITAVAQFVLIQPGSFPMGSTNGFIEEQPVHTVTLTTAFWLQTTEVTQGQWRAVMGNNPSFFSSCGDDCPVDTVSWDDIQTFLQRLNAANPGANYRLPTEAEWEFAARAGTTGDYGGNGVLNDMGWYAGNSGGTTHRVGQKRANAWGLYDMHGNVYEWVQDWYSVSYYGVSPSSDPPGPSNGSLRVLRGGSWIVNASLARSTYRGRLEPALPGAGDFGFRLARTP